QQTSSPWCNNIYNENSGVKCIPHVNAYGKCNLFDHGYTLNPEHVHFDSLPNVLPEEQSRFGGYDTYADHCPYMFILDDVHMESQNSHCEDTNNQNYQRKFPLFGLLTMNTLNYHHTIYYCEAAKYAIERYN
ncbi:unnamed protein product, partial [Schistosoma spindalis]